MNWDTKRFIKDNLAGAATQQLAHWVRRYELQLEFALSFAKLQDEAISKHWQALIGDAEATLASFDPADGLDGFVAAVKGAEQLLAPIGNAAKRYAIKCVGHGHIDMNWMWSWPETVATTHDTFASVLNLMDQYPDVTYSQSQASVYALIEKHHPEMFEAIQRRVAEGRWEVTAVHWVEGDKNLSSGESLVRHMLYTRAYFLEKFGLTPEDVPVDWEPDTFGHANTIPSIITGGAARYYYSCRQGGGFEHARIGEPRPRLFYWLAPNGDRVLVNRESTWYNSYVNIGDNIALPMVEFVRETGLHQWLNIYGIGNHGGGPTRKEIDYLLSLQEWPIYPRVEFGTATAYFRDVEKELTEEGIVLPVLQQELNFEFTGCYTSQSAIKRGNRWGENYLEDAETLALLGERLGGVATDSELLRQAWINVLFNQFHDILPGSGVRETREHAQALFQEVGAITGSIKRRVGAALACKIDTLALLPDNHAGRAERALAVKGSVNTPFVAGSGIGAMETGYSQSNGGGRSFLPFVVYNPSTWSRTERVQVALYDTDFDASRVAARDDLGVSHPTMLLSKGGDWGHEKLTVAFDAIDVPALGYRTYLLCEGEVDADYEKVTYQTGDWLETPYFRIRLDRFRTGIVELIDRRTNVQLVGPSGPTFGSWQFVNERPRGMTAWVIGEELEAPIELLPTSFGVHGVARNEGTSAPIGGPTMGYRVEWRLEVPGTKSRVNVTLMVHPLEPRLDFKAEIDWREIGDEQRGIPGLVVSFPANLDPSITRYETPFGSVERDLNNGDECPTLRYVHLGGQTEAGAYAGITLVQDSKYGHAVKGNDLRMRIVRSSFDPDHAPEVARSTVRYSVILHDQAVLPSELSRLGAAWNHPFLIVPTGIQSGDACAADGFAEVLSANTVLTAIKAAEDGNGIILRLAEQDGVDGETVIKLSSELTHGLTSATRTDLLERPIESGVVTTWDGTTLRTPIAKHSIVTIRLS